MRQFVANPYSEAMAAVAAWVAVTEWRIERYGDGVRSIEHCIVDTADEAIARINSNVVEL